MKRPNKYFTWLEKASKQVSNDFCEGKFNPDNESDIKVRLCGALESTKAQVQSLTTAHYARTEFPVPNSLERIDVAIVKKTKAGNRPRLLLEIKETSKAHLSLGEIRTRIESDIEKLRRCSKALEDEGKDIPDLVVFFFFRGDHEKKSRPIHGIGVRTAEGMERLKREHDDVILVWGPR